MESSLSSKRSNKTAGIPSQIRKAAVELSVPSALMAYALAVWKVGSDAGKLGWFPIESGVAAHWQVWLAVGLIVHLGAVFLRLSIGVARIPLAAGKAFRASRKDAAGSSGPMVWTPGRIGT